MSGTIEACGEPSALLAQKVNSAKPSGTSGEKEHYGDYTFAVSNQG